MSMTLQEQIDRVNAAPDPETLWVVARDFYYDRGARMIAYRHFVGRPEPHGEIDFVAEGFPEGFIERLMEQRLTLVNPIPDLAARTADPLFWSDVGAMTDLLEDEAHFVNDRVLASIGDGLAIQVFGPMSRNGLFNMGFGGARPALDRRAVKELQLAGQASHLAYIRMTPDYGQTDAPMTAREREVLDWIAKGKSNSVIADILGISVHTVDTHVRRIFRKLEVNDRTTAAVKGLGAGLVQTAA